LICRRWVVRRCPREAFLFRSNSSNRSQKEAPKRRTDTLNRRPPAGFNFGDGEIVLWRVARLAPPKVPRSFLVALLGDSPSATKIRVLQCFTARTRMYLFDIHDLAPSTPVVFLTRMWVALLVWLFLTRKGTLAGVALLARKSRYSNILWRSRWAARSLPRGVSVTFACDEQGPQDV